MRILADAGVPASPLSGFFRNLIEKYGDSDSIFSTHPLSSERATKFESVEDASGAPILTDAEWAQLRSICD